MSPRPTSRPRMDAISMRTVSRMKHNRRMGRLATQARGSIAARRGWGKYSRRPSTRRISFAVGAHAAGRRRIFIAPPSATENGFLLVREPIEYLPSLDGQITQTLSSPLHKNIPLSPSGKSALPARAISPDERGGSRSSRTCGGMRWTRIAAKDERRYLVRRSRVVLTPRCWCQVLERLTLLGGDGDKKARSPGRARYKP
jgi:hypothetical protein